MNIVPRDLTNVQCIPAGEIRTIPLTRGKYAVVDAADYEWLSQWKWCAGGKGYAERWSRNASGHRIKIGMHSLIIGIKPGYEPDHVNGDRLDNRRSNLRHATRSQNMANKKARQGTSLYKGVSWSKCSKKWRADIMKNRKQQYIGSFATESEAAAAYNRVAVILFGEFARLNRLEV